ncbi:MAG: hypothetical protein ACKPDM_24190 [Dolichospermum sp.]
MTDHKYAIGTVINSGHTGNIENNSINHVNVTNTNIEPRQTLAEAAAEIQKLLKQLESTNPNTTEQEKIDYVDDETTPSFKRRAVNAIKAGGQAVIEEVFDNPYINVGIAILNGWKETVK